MDLFRANVNLLPPLARSFRYYFQLFSNHPSTDKSRPPAGLRQPSKAIYRAHSLASPWPEKNLAGNHRENEATISMFSSAESRAMGGARGTNHRAWLCLVQ